jgi:pimeloyl-ACP methyl ester carboxylesterase
MFTPLFAPWLVRTDIAKAFAPDPVPKKYLRHVLAEWTRPRKVKWYSVDDALLNISLPKFADRYPEIAMPVAIVTGDADQIVPAAQNAERLHHALPDSQLNLLPRTGHQIPSTRPEAVLAAIDHIAAISSRN